MKQGFKFLLILFGVFAIFCFSFFIFNKNATKNISTPQAKTEDVKEYKTEINTNDTRITIQTKDGPVEVNNIYKIGQSLGTNGDLSLKNDPNYSITFYSQDSGFIIAILNPALQKYRDLAEEDFLNILETSKDNACKLKVTLDVPFDISEIASGKNYGLSFCPNGIPFPVPAN